MGFNQLSLIRKAAITGLLVALAMPVFASSDEAWAEHDRKVTQKCTAASQLINAVVSSKPILFDDKVGYTAITLRGHLKPVAGSTPKATATQEKLCLYMRKTGQVHVADISPATR